MYSFESKSDCKVEGLGLRGLGLRVQGLRVFSSQRFGNG